MSDEGIAVGRVDAYSVAGFGKGPSCKFYDFAAWTGGIVIESKANVNGFACSVACFRKIVGTTMTIYENGVFGLQKCG